MKMPITGAARKARKARGNSVGKALPVIRQQQPGMLALPPDRLSALVRNEPLEKFYTIEDEPLGSGNISEVYRLRRKDTGAYYAGKFISLSRIGTDMQEVRNEAMHEIALLEACRGSSRMIRLFEVYQDPDRVALVLEYAMGGDLQSVLDADQVPMEADVARFLRQILDGIAFLHERNVAHLDLKPQNLMLTGPFPCCDVKLCDFESCRFLDCELREMLGTPDYVAPEILHYESITTACDMWSLGVLTYVLLTGCSPFGGETAQETFLNITRGRLDFPAELFGEISKDAQEFIQSLLQLNPKARPTARQCLQHPWLTRRSHRRRRNLYKLSASARPPSMPALPFYKPPSKPPSLSTLFRSSQLTLLAASTPSLMTTSVMTVSTPCLVTTLSPSSSFKGEADLTNLSQDSAIEDEGSSDEGEKTPTNEEEDRDDEDQKGFKNCNHQKLMSVIDIGNWKPRDFKDLNPKSATENKENRRLFDSRSPIRSRDQPKTEVPSKKEENSDLKGLVKDVPKITVTLFSDKEPDSDKPEKSAAKTQLATQDDDSVCKVPVAEEKKQDSDEKRSPRTSRWTSPQTSRKDSTLEKESSVLDRKLFPSTATEAIKDNENNKVVPKIRLATLEMEKRLESLRAKRTGKESADDDSVMKDISQSLNVDLKLDKTQEDPDSSNAKENERIGTVGSKRTPAVGQAAIKSKFERGKSEDEVRRDEVRERWKSRAEKEQEDSRLNQKEKEAEKKEAKEGLQGLEKREEKGEGRVKERRQNLDKKEDGLEKRVKEGRQSPDQLGEGQEKWTKEGRRSPDQKGEKREKQVKEEPQSSDQTGEGREKLVKEWRLNPDQRRERREKWAKEWRLRPEEKGEGREKQMRDGPQSPDQQGEGREKLVKEWRLSSDQKGEGRDKLVKDGRQSPDQKGEGREKLTKEWRLNLDQKGEGREKRVRDGPQSPDQLGEGREKLVKEWRLSSDQKGEGREKIVKDGRQSPDQKGEGREKVVKDGRQSPDQKGEGREKIVKDGRQSPDQKGEGREKLVKDGRQSPDQKREGREKRVRDGPTSPDQLGEGREKLVKEWRLNPDQKGEGRDKLVKDGRQSPDQKGEGREKLAKEWRLNPDQKGEGRDKLVKDGRQSPDLKREGREKRVKEEQQSPDQSGEGREKLVKEWRLNLDQKREGREKLVKDGRQSPDQKGEGRDKLAKDGRQSPDQKGEGREKSVKDERRSPDQKGEEQVKQAKEERQGQDEKEGREKQVEVEQHSPTQKGDEQENHVQQKWQIQPKCGDIQSKERRPSLPAFQSSVSEAEHARKLEAIRERLEKRRISLPAINRPWGRICHGSYARALESFRSRCNQFEDLPEETTRHGQ